MDEQIQNLVNRFAEAARLQQEYALASDWHNADAQGEQVDDLFRQIVWAGNDARDALLALSDHENPAIASIAALYSLRHNPERCLSVLRRLTSEPGLLGFEAGQAVRRWEEGNWHLEDEVMEDTGSHPYALPSANEPQPDARMSADLDALLRRLPRKVKWDDIPDFKGLDDRVPMANGFCPFTIGVNMGNVEWVPDHRPPRELEKLTWAWVIRPDLSAAIAARAPEELRQEIMYYLRRRT